MSHLLIYVADLNTTTDFNFRLNAETRIYGPLKYRAKKYGLSYYLGSKEGPAPSVHIPRIPPEQTYQEIFIGPAPVEVYLTCNGNAAVPYPGCHEVFTTDGLLFDIKFRKPHLKEWKAIRRAAIDLMKRFEVKSADLERGKP